jgi:WD40 repeat protein
MPPYRADNTCAAFRPQARFAATGYGATVDVWETTSWKRIAALVGHEDVVTAISFSRDGARIATGGADKIARIWDTATGRSTARLRGNTNAITDVALCNPCRGLTR